MFAVPSDDSTLSCLRGLAVPSPRSSAVEYRLLRPLGQGGMATTFLALRSGPDGDSPAVLKVFRPDFVIESGEVALLSIQKEAAALARLGERVPPTPLVVRLIEAGELEVSYEGEAVRLPWLALEYVHGGAEGTTLLERVTHTVEATGFAFDTARAARAIDCLTRGVAAVHEVGILHRDIKPANILCCGFGDDELLKLADFGLARAGGVAETFMLGGMGTPGFAPPELLSLDQRRSGPWTDVFGTACVIFYLLTGEGYFGGPDLESVMAQIRKPSRRSLLDTQGLAPDLRAMPGACRAIDMALARATAPKHEERTPTVEALAASLLIHLETESVDSAPTRGRMMSVLAAASSASAWTWSTPFRPEKSMAIRRLDWDSDGCCLAITTEGLAFWTGTEWRPVTIAGVDGDARVVHRVGPGRWLVGGPSTFAVCTFRGVEEHVDTAQARGTIEHVSGDIGDLAVFVVQTSNTSLALQARIGRRWLKPTTVADAAAISSLARVDDSQWLVSGRRRDGRSLAALYSPLEFLLTPLEGPPSRALLASAGEPFRRVGLAAGTEGGVVWWEDEQATTELIPGAANLSTAAVDILGQGWAAGPGCIWLRRDRAWTKVWHDETWSAPFVSLFVEPHLIIAVTADGRILEGRMHGIATDIDMSEWDTLITT